ncbi:MAG: JAB domain-containing protein [Chthoniobacterales bacterium]
MSLSLIPEGFLKPLFAIQLSLSSSPHNHPSDDPSPSEADIRLTRKISEAAHLMQIQMLDHIVMGAPANGRPGYFAFK